MKQMVIYKHYATREHIFSKFYILYDAIFNMEEKEIGKVSTYFSHVNVAAIKLSGKLKVGDKVHIKGHTTDFELKVGEIQIDRKPVKEAKAKDHIGIKVPEKVRPHDKILLVK
jgi:hypothetical protein